jgi:4-carboxymuconolactone decarboxylase
MQDNMSDTNGSPMGALSQAVGSVSPILVKYTQENIDDELWSRPGLSPRDRSIVTLCALISRNPTTMLPHYFNKALDCGLKPGEISELIAHLAFYASWANAFAATVVLKDIFTHRGIGADQLPEVSPKLLSTEEALPDEDSRLAFIAANVAPGSPAVQHFTDDLLYHQVWLRPGLAPRDRGLATVAILSALGQSAFLPFYMNRAVLKGVTKEQIGEALGHIAFYAGWGNAILAAGVVKDFFAGRAG